MPGVLKGRESPGGTLPQVACPMGAPKTGKEAALPCTCAYLFSFYISFPQFLSCTCVTAGCEMAVVATEIRGNWVLSEKM